MATATLPLRRNGRVFGHRHAWQILLDGKPAGSIADDDAARVPAEPAPYPAAVIGAVHQPGAVLRGRRRGGGQLHLPADLAAGRSGSRRAQSVDQLQTGVKPRQPPASLLAVTTAAEIVLQQRGPIPTAPERRIKVSPTLKVTQEAFTNPAGIMRGTFDVVVDGKSVGSIKWHETIETPVEPGRHTLQVRKGRYSSRVKTFDAAEDEFVAFRCNRRRHPLVLAATLVKPNLAISLTRE